MISISESYTYFFDVGKQKSVVLPVTASDNDFDYSRVNQKGIGFPSTGSEPAKTLK